MISRWIAHQVLYEVSNKYTLENVCEEALLKDHIQENWGIWR